MTTTDPAMIAAAFICLSASAFAQNTTSSIPNAEGQDQSPTLNKRASMVQGQWTVDTLREYLTSIIDANDRRYSARFDAQEKAVIAALDSAKEAVLKAEGSSEKRFESVNEFRKTLSDQTAQFITRAEYAAARQGLDDRVSVNNTKMERMEAKTSGIDGVWVWLLQIASLLLALYAVVRAPRAAVTVQCPGKKI